MLNTFEEMENLSRENIESAKNLWIETKHEVDKYEKLLKLAFENYIKTVQREVRPHFMTYLVEDAANWLKMRNKKHDRRKKYAEKEVYESLCQRIKEDLTDCDVEVEEILRGGYETYYWSIKFKCNDTHYSLIMPEPSAINIKNFYYAHEGKHWLGIYTNDYVCTEIKSSYRFEDLKEAFKLHEIVKNNEES